MPDQSELIHPYLNPDLPIADRVQDLLSRMTLPEKISQMRNGCSAIPRLGIPAYDFWNEGLHGVARNGRATVFPQAIGMAATWDKDLVKRVASAISEEGRAKYHEALRKNGKNLIYQGITFWSPNVNIFRDPRWGRGQETWGEDPYLTGEMGAEFVKGLQGDHPRYMKAAACAKHYAVHSGPERDRHTFNAVVSKRDLNATYLPAFKKLVTEAKVEAVMGAYNRTNDEACCASELLLDHYLREKWGFQGHVVSDCGALSDIHLNHKITNDPAETCALALKHGCDLGCDHVYFDHLQEAIDRGLITEADIDVSLARTLATRFKLGMFDPQEMVPYSAISMDVVGCQAHVDLAYEAARKSIVLLKNKNNILPLKNLRTALVVGPSATSLEVLLGNYYGMNKTLTSILEGILGAVPEGVKLEYRQGCMLNQPNKAPMDWSVYEAASADVTIACVGFSPLMEGEEGDAILSDQNGDRLSIDLPAAQADYLKKIIVGGAKVVLVVTGGSPIVLGELADMVEAVVYVWYPGQEGGRAVADVLFGNAVPSGKLPLTFPKSISQLPPFEDYRMTGRTYRYAAAEPLYPFGFGLSYTQFEYTNLSLSANQIKTRGSVVARFTLSNKGSIAADEVVQYYLSDLEASVEVPVASLIGFERVHLEPGQSRDIEFTVTPDMMKLVNDEGELVLEPGMFRLNIGSCSPGVRALELGAAKPLCAVFEVK